MAGHSRTAACLALLACLALAAAGRPPPSAPAPARGGAAAGAARRPAPAPARKSRPEAARQSQPSFVGLDTDSKKLRVLAFGDSITEGWIQTAWTKQPWSPRLQQKLQDRLGSEWQVEVVNGGVGSAGVLDRLNDAFRQQLSTARSQGQPYHYITFEAGINDLLLQKKNAPEIFERMKELWALANAEGSIVLVIPTLPTNVTGEREEQRQALTKLVRDHVEAQKAAGYRGLDLIDLERQFDYYRLSPERRAQVFDDGVHMTPYGYEFLGDLVFRGFARSADLDEAARAAGRARRRPGAGSP